MLVSGPQQSMDRSQHFPPELRHRDDTQPEAFCSICAAFIKMRDEHRLLRAPAMRGIELMPTLGWISIDQNDEATRFLRDAATRLDKAILSAQEADELTKNTPPPEMAAEKVSEAIAAVWEVIQDIRTTIERAEAS
jgi:hypothetical protein